MIEEEMMSDMLSVNTFFSIATAHLSVHASQAGRALLVAALLISIYALVRYWRNLAGRPVQVRYTLISLRALGLLLLACTLAGVSLEYETKPGARVLLSRLVGGVQATGEDERTAKAEAAIAALRARGFEIVEAETDVSSPGRDGGFVAGVLLTDGMASGDAAERAIERLSLAAGEAPVFTMADDSRTAEPSVVLEDVAVLGSALRGVPFGVRCVVRGRGMRGRESLLTVSDDAKVQASLRVAWTSDDELRVLTVFVTPKVAGWIDYSAKIEAAGVEDASLRVRPFTVYVQEKRLRVLFFEGQPTWEAKFIRRALEQSGLFEIDYSAQVSRAAVVGISEDAAEPKAEETSGQPPAIAPLKKKRGAEASTPEAGLRAALQSAAQLNAYDCVIVGATEDSLLSSTESARLREWVERRGGGLIVLGGNSFSGSIAAPNGKLYSLLPAETGVAKMTEGGQEISRGRPLEAETARGGVSLAPTAAGASGALSGYLSASAEPQTKTDMLTGEGLRLGGLRPGASVLAVAGRTSAQETTQEGAALIAAMRYGAGRTLVFAPADSWRIRAGASGDEERAGGTFNALWQGLVLWTAAGARSPVEIVLNENSPAAGSLVTAEIRAHDAATFAPLKIERLSARLQSLTEVAVDEPGANAVAEPLELGFAPDPSDVSVWRARFPVETQGRFALEIEYLAGGQSGRVEKYFAVFAPTAQSASPALDTLRRASRERGGELFNAADANLLRERLAAIPTGKERERHRLELRSWWPLAFLIPLLLSIEWFARRWWKED